MQAEARTEILKARQERSKQLADAEIERDRLLRDAEGAAAEVKSRAQYDAVQFEQRLAEYQRFRVTNPDYLHDIWLNEVMKAYKRMLEKGGRIEPLLKLNDIILMQTPGGGEK